MKYITGVLLMIALTIPTGIWLDHTLPHYGFALGFGIGFAFIIGVFTNINKQLPPHALVQRYNKGEKEKMKKIKQKQKVLKTINDFINHFAGTGDWLIPKSLRTRFIKKISREIDRLAPEIITEQNEKPRIL